MTTEPTHLQNTAFAITERCTLKCKLCIAFIPYHVNPRDLTIDEISTILERYFSIVSSVDYFCLTGGEPLMHPDLLTIFNMLLPYYSQINKATDITTNGTLDFKEEVIQFLKKHKERVRVIISDYGKVSPKAGILTEKLSSLGIAFRVEHYKGKSPLYGGWIDCRDHSLKHFTQYDIDEQGESCHYKNKRGYPIRNGELHNCARSYWRMLQNIIPRNPEEYIGLLDTSESVDVQRDKLRNLHKRVSVTSCAYCWGSNDNRERHTPAEQIDNNSQGKLIL